MREGISFTCHACRWDGAGDKPELHAPARARLSAFAGCVRWLAGEPAAETPLLDEAPATGEEHWLAVRLPFCAEAGERFNCLYQPPLSHRNGWSEHPDELGRSAIAACTLLGIESVRDDGAAVRVGVHDVLAVEAIGSRFAPSGRIGADFWQSFATQTVHTARWGALICVHGSFEGDVATTGVFQRRGSRSHLVLEGFSSHHADFVFAGNSPLDAEAESTLQRMLARSSRG